MNEKEIIRYLKENRKNGVIYDFMPFDVRYWCSEHRDESIFYFYSTGYGWNGPCTIDCGGRSVYCLVDDHELEPQFKPDFVEFDVNENGYFYYEGKEYYYRDDVAFEKHNSDTFKGFGGWLYECKNGPIWVTTPHIAREGHLYTCMRLNENQNEITAPIPSKIRFWRYKE